MLDSFIFRFVSKIAGMLAGMFPGINEQEMVAKVLADQNSQAMRISQMEAAIVDMTC